MYVHIPFCEKRCGYCAFAVAPVGKNKEFLGRAAERYIEALKWEMGRSFLLYGKQWSQDDKRKSISPSVNTVFFGGGTPTMLSVGQLGQIVSAIRSNFKCEPNQEWSIEAHPGTFLGEDAREKIQGIKNLGFNRISFGLESLKEETLKKLYRDYTFKDIAGIIRLCHDVGLSNINFDLICGWPQETKEDFMESLKLAVSLEPKHLSIYPLQIEENTTFSRMGVEVNLDHQAEEFVAAHDFLTAQGYDHYEIANYSKPGFESKHNLAYWYYEDYLGIGLGAASKIGMKSFTNVRAFEPYLKACQPGASPIGEDILLSEDDLTRRKVILGLRLSQGVSTATLESVVDAGTLSDFRSQGHLLNKNGNSYLTPQGWLISNQLFSALV